MFYLLYQMHLFCHEGLFFVVRLWRDLCERKGIARPAVLAAHIYLKTRAACSSLDRSLAVKVFITVAVRCKSVTYGVLIILCLFKVHKTKNICLEPL